MKDNNIKITKVVGELQTVKLNAQYGEQLLSGCKSERRLKGDHVDFIKRSMIYSGWNNSSTISVSESGELLDGQHRLHALKQLGWPKINIQVCVYKNKDITPELRSSFNKACKQSVSDTMKMVYGWDNVALRCSLAAALYRTCINIHGKCDDVATLQIDKAFGSEMLEFVKCAGTHHVRGRLTGEQIAAFLIERLMHGPSRAGNIQRLFVDVTNALNFDSNNCIGKRIWDFCHEYDSNGKNVGRGSTLGTFRIAMAIDMLLKGKRVCGILKSFKDEDVQFFADNCRAKIQQMFNEVDF